MRYDHGDVYEGQWRNRKKHGEGTYTFADGGQYKGQYRDGKMQLSKSQRKKKSQKRGTSLRGHINTNARPKKHTKGDARVGTHKQDDVDE